MSTKKEHIFDFYRIIKPVDFSTGKWRREGDLNPRTGTTRLLVFEASPFSLLGTSPRYLFAFSRGDYINTEREAFQER